MEALNKNLPVGVVESLSRVATQDGFLTFERFCAGIKIAILRQEAAMKRKKLGEPGPENSSNLVAKNGPNNYENVCPGSDSSNEYSVSVQNRILDDSAFTLELILIGIFRRSQM